MGHKSSLSKFKKTEIVSGIFSDHKGMRLDNNYRKNTAKNTNSWRLNETINNEEVTENKKGNQKIARNKWQWKHDNTKPMGFSKSSSKREVYSDIIIPQKTTKALNRQPNCTSKAAGKRKTKNPQKST